MSYHDHLIEYGKEERELILSLKDVSKIFSHKGCDNVAVDKVSFDLYSNESLGIIGESGSGKSTIAKIITGLHKATSGQIFFEGKDITHLNRKERKHLYSDIQMVFQNPVGSFNPRRKIGKSLIECMCQLCAENANEAEKKAEEHLLDVGLSADYVNRYPHEMSGGECQRAAIARAMSVCPRMLICDEATSALDVSAQARIVNLLMDLKEKNKMSMIFITHDLPLVSTITDKIIIMNKGKIVEAGKTSEIISNPKTEYTKELLNAVL